MKKTRDAAAGALGRACQSINTLGYEKRKENGGDRGGRESPGYSSLVVAPTPFLLRACAIKPVHLQPFLLL